jgi:hypothetical protein
MRTIHAFTPCLRRPIHLLLVLLMWGCDSQGTSRDASAAVSPADTRVLDGQREVLDDAKDAPAVGNDASLDGQPDVAIGADSVGDGGGDLPGAGGLADGGPDSLGVFACKFPVGSPTPIFCPYDQYCVSLGGGAMGSGTTFSCAVPPSACVGKLTCECLCGTGGPGNCSPSGGGAHCQCIANPDGPSLLCAAP